MVISIKASTFYFNVNLKIAILYFAIHEIKHISGAQRNLHG